MPFTMLNQYFYPEEDADPYYEEFVGMIGSFDVALYQNKNRSHAFMCGGGIFTWNALSNTFYWTDDIKIPLIMSGFVVSVVYGPSGVSRSAAIQPGTALYVRLPSAITANVNKNAETASQISYDDAIFVLAYNCDNILYLRNGQMLS